MTPHTAGHSVPSSPAAIRVVLALNPGLADCYNNPGAYSVRVDTGEPSAYPQEVEAEVHKLAALVDAEIAPLVEAYYNALPSTAMRSDRIEYTREELDRAYALGADYSPGPKYNDNTKHAHSAEGSI